MKIFWKFIGLPQVNFFKESLRNPIEFVMLWGWEPTGNPHVMSQTISTRNDTIYEFWFSLVGSCRFFSIQPPSISLCNNPLCSTGLSKGTVVRRRSARSSAKPRARSALGSASATRLGSNRSAPPTRRESMRIAGGARHSGPRGHSGSQNGPRRRSARVWRQTRRRRRRGIRTGRRSLRSRRGGVRSTDRDKKNRFRFTFV